MVATAQSITGKIPEILDGGCAEIVVFSGRLKNMIEIKGTRRELAKAMEGIAPKYPATLIQHLDTGEWHFIIAEVDVLVMIEEEA